MKRLFILACCLSLLLPGWAFAGPLRSQGTTGKGTYEASAGTPKLEGTTWKGTYDAIRPDGTKFDDLEMEFVFMKQFESLFQGQGTVEVPIGPGPETEKISIPFTLNISQDKTITGIAQYDFGLALTFEGKWNGKTMTGVAVDPTDGATSVFNLKQQ